MTSDASPTTDDATPHGAASGASDRVVFNARSSDPTASRTLRETFARQFRSRWRTLRGEQRRQLREYDLSAPPARLLASYRRWFDRTADAVVLEPTGPGAVERGRHWTATHVRQAYQKGLRRAQRDLRAAGYPDAVVAAATTERAAAHRDALAHEYQTAYYETEDAVATLRKHCSRRLKTGLQDRDSTSDVVAALNDEVARRGGNATNALASTVVVETINEALLVCFERAGVEQVGVQVEGVDASPEVVVTNGARVNAAGEVEWETAGDRRVCPECSALEGITIEISEIRGQSHLQPPIHPQCRCIIVPAPMDGNK